MIRNVIFVWNSFKFFRNLPRKQRVDITYHFLGQVNNSGIIIGNTIIQIDTNGIVNDAESIDWFTIKTLFKFYKKHKKRSIEKFEELCFETV